MEIVRKEREAKALDDCTFRNQMLEEIGRVGSMKTDRKSHDDAVEQIATGSFLGLRHLR